MFQDSSLIGTGPAYPFKVSFSVRSIQSDLQVEAFDDQIQIGGSCNPGAKILNYFEFQLFPKGQGAVVINQAGMTANERLRLADARCENGKFYLVLPILCPSEGGPIVTATDTALVKITFHAFDSFDPNKKPVNLVSIDQTIFVTLAPQGGCP